VTGHASTRSGLTALRAVHQVPHGTRPGSPAPSATIASSTPLLGRSAAASLPSVRWSPGPVLLASGPGALRPSSSPRLPDLTCPARHATHPEIRRASSTGARTAARAGIHAGIPPSRLFHPGPGRRHVRTLRRLPLEPLGVRVRRRLRDARYDHACPHFASPGTARQPFVILDRAYRKATGPRHARVRAPRHNCDQHDPRASGLRLPCDAPVATARRLLKLGCHPGPHSPPP